MNASLKRLHSPDVPDLHAFKPEAPDDFGFVLQMMVGPEGGEGEEAFDVQVCTPKWLASHYAPEDVVPLRHHILLLEWNYDRLATALRQLVESCSGPTWPRVAEMVGRVGLWEYEDYRP